MYPDKMDQFARKLNKKQNGSVYVIEEKHKITEGKFEGQLAHDNITTNTIRVYTGEKLTGEEIKGFTVSVPAETPWKRSIKIFTAAMVVYITYETTGDVVEADDINVLQEAVVSTQAEVERYKVFNDKEIAEMDARLGVAEQNKAEKTYVDSKLLLKADKSGTTLAISEGGTGQTTAAGVRNTLGLGNTTGSLPVANGGTGASTAAQALTNMGLTATATELNYMDGVTANVQTQLTLKAPLSSPVFTGTPIVPTASSGTNTTQAASTAFAQQELSVAGYSDMRKAIYDTNNDGVVDAAQSVPWIGITGKPGTFPPSSHTHDSSTLSGMSTDKLSEPAYVTGGVTLTAKNQFDVLRADRTAFLPASQIIVEKSTDAGATWEDAGVSDVNKLRLFTGQRPSVSLPLKNGVRSTDCMIRVTITGMRYNVPAGTLETGKYSYWNSTNVQSTERYCNLETGWIWLSSSNDRIYCKVERATGVNPNNWAADGEAYMNGWSGGNQISLSGNVLGGGANQTGNWWNWRFTFRTCSPSNTFKDADLATGYQTQTQAIHHIKVAGRNVWNMPNRYMYNDHLYDWDEFQNALFPAIVQGTQLKSTIAAGSAPFIVVSPTLIENLNADMLDGKHANDFMKKGPLTWNDFKGV